MSENDQPPEPPQQSKAAEFPSLPQVFPIPTQLIEAWLKIAPSAYLEAPLTRQDWDSLFFGLTKIVETQQLIQDCIIRWSNGDLAEANKVMDASKRRAIESENHIRQFFTALMAAAKVKS